MKRIPLACLLALAACATAAEPELSPTPRGIESALIAEMEARSPSGARVVHTARVTDLSCRTEQGSCFQCSYAAETGLFVGGGGGEQMEMAEVEPRADMVCGVAGGWRLTPMSEVGS